MNPFESFMGKPKQDPIDVPAMNNEPVSEWKAEWHRQNALIEDAKTRYEGMVLYSPLSPEQKSSVLKKLEEVRMDPNSHAETFSDKRGGDDSLLASLWVDRKMRGFISSLKGTLPEEDFNNLERALEGLTIPEGSKFWKVTPGEGKWNVKTKYDKE